jgi:hypothetical protein
MEGDGGKRRASRGLGIPRGPENSQSGPTTGFFSVSAAFGPAHPQVAKSRRARHVAANRTSSTCAQCSEGAGATGGFMNESMMAPWRSPLGFSPELNYAISFY